MESDKGLWTNSSDELVRIRAVDLRDLTHKTAAARQDCPHAVIVVDIDVVIALDVRAARTAMSDSAYESGDTMVYVGTPAGLSGLIADIYALGIADGAILRPVHNDGVLDLIHDVVVPELQTMAAA
ncbi:hypothetical protein [Mycolicibacterium porcinum]|uniref:hypothetical protein n=1 Tax=Mycolicibacterium porcinum TaxID=39693 RepID=UPI00256F518C|nr:hypothetical protein [Mycolicibacterium porcinum]